MWYYILVPIIFVVYIFELIYLYRIYNETKTDPFQQPLGFEEKKKFFNYTINYELYMNKFDYNCKVYQDLILEPDTKKLGDVFNIKTEIIHYGCIFSFLTAYILFWFAFLPLVLNPCLKMTCRSLISFFLQNIACSNLTSALIGPINIIVIIISINSFYNSDINAYFDFLTCENINYAAFEKYRNIESLKTDFKNLIIPFIILWILSFAYFIWELHSVRNRN